jgi:hypothetical protein
MELDKSRILELLRQSGDQGQADQAAQQLPDKVDTDQHRWLLVEIGIDPGELIGRFGGGNPGSGGLLP